MYNRNLIKTSLFQNCVPHLKVNVLDIIRFGPFQKYMMYTKKAWKYISINYISLVCNVLGRNKCTYMFVYISSPLSASISASEPVYVLVSVPVFVPISVSFFVFVCIFISFCFFICKTFCSRFYVWSCFCFYFCL